MLVGGAVLVVGGAVVVGWAVVVVARAVLLGGDMTVAVALFTGFLMVHNN